MSSRRVDVSRNKLHSRFIVMMVPSHPLRPLTKPSNSIRVFIIGICISCLFNLHGLSRPVVKDRATIISKRNTGCWMNFAGQLEVPNSNTKELSSCTADNI